MSSEGSAPMNGGGDGDESREKERPPDEENKFKDANVKDYGLKVNGEINIGGEIGQGNLQSQNQQQQSQGTPFCWERFLHIRTIKVLLVENDDSTRHIVAALLRNCNYEVIEVSNGLQAWKILEDLTNHVDLILSEVVMPCVSGIGLLCKIMSHKSRKNIPVIMMSSHDSMGLVFKCLSKGAVDFLVKPIRKNELKNLWQHVWRRCHSSSGSGSGSESCSQTQKSIKSESCEKLVNHSGSNDNKEDNGLHIGDGSDDGSGAQSSWTKQPKKVDSSRETSPVDQADEFEDSTCAQVIHSNAEATSTKQFQAFGTENCHLLQRGKTIKREVKSDAIEASSNHIGAQQNAPLEIYPSINGNMKDKSFRCPKGDYQPNDHQVVCTTTSGPKNPEKPTVELSIKRLREIQETGKDVQDDHNILRHSELSAFSRYNASAFTTPNCIGITRSSSVINKSLDNGKKELDFDIHCHSYDNILYPSSKRGSNSAGIGSTTDKLLPSPLIFLSEATSAINGLRPSSAFGRDSHQQLPIQERHHHHHYHINHFHNFENDQQMSSNEELSLRKMDADAPHCGSSNVPGGPGKANPINHSFERSASGSNFGSNGNNGTNEESDMVINLQSGSGSGNRIDLNKLAQREAALAKYRQKRKERCFNKRVRYQNRKRLAEMRPRVRGQFVRKTEQDNSSSAEADEQ